MRDATVSWAMSLRFYSVENQFPRLYYDAGPHGNNSQQLIFLLGIFEFSNVFSYEIQIKRIMQSIIKIVWWMSAINKSRIRRVYQQLDVYCVVLSSKKCRSLPEMQKLTINILSSGHQKFRTFKLSDEGSIRKLKRPKLLVINVYPNSEPQILKLYMLFLKIFIVAWKMAFTIKNCEKISGRESYFWSIGGVHATSPIFTSLMYR